MEIPWRPVDLSTSEVKFGVMWDDGDLHNLLDECWRSNEKRKPGVVSPSPACRRALQMTIDALKSAGYEVTDL